MEQGYKKYYEQVGFSTYYVVNIVFNVVRNPSNYMRNLEDIFGDASTETFMRSFPRTTNLHIFLEDVIRSVIGEDVDKLYEGVDPRFLKGFLQAYRVPYEADVLADGDAFYQFASESEEFDSAIDALADEAFHVLFNDLGFLRGFNSLVSRYIENSAVGQEWTIKSGRLKRISIPQWARRAVFHRDKGECRTCKRNLDFRIKDDAKERYDHIIPLALFGANDLTNLQLLCEECNLKKGMNDVPISPLYPRAFPKG